MYVFAWGNVFTFSHIWLCVDYDNVIYPIGPFYAGPYWRYFGFAALIRAVIRAKTFFRIVLSGVKLIYRLMTKYK